jgi:HK97 family phage prohead protease
METAHPSVGSSTNAPTTVVLKTQDFRAPPPAERPPTDGVQDRPPRDDLYRARARGTEFRDDDGGAPRLTGHFARFNEWTEIDSVWEGEFMERIAPGAFSKTINDQRNDMRVLFEHGRDPDLGNKPIGAIQELREDDEGAYYEAELFDGLPPLVMQGLRAKQYGASFRFRVMREEFENDAKASDHNPRALPERTIKEAQVFEFGPVTFPAYAGASAGVRSLTDEMRFGELLRRPEHLRQLIDLYTEKDDGDDAEAEPHLIPESAEAEPHPRNVVPPSPAKFKSREEFLRWIGKT